MHQYIRLIHKTHIEFVGILKIKSNCSFVNFSKSITVSCYWQFDEGKKRLNVTKGNESANHFVYPENIRNSTNTHTHTHNLYTNFTLSYFLTSTWPKVAKIEQLAFPFTFSLLLLLFVCVCVCVSVCLFFSRVFRKLDSGRKFEWSIISLSADILVHFHLLSCLCLMFHILRK